ncbi:MAG: hypothetical protein NC184_00915 [Roseburia sp.]|nr:hypothetical protein [Roseburia sp.]
MELYYEQNVVNKNIDERAKKTKTLIIAKTICLFFGVSILMLFSVLWVYYWLIIPLSIPFFVATFILGRINKRNNTEYDYVLDDEALKITEIYFRNTRKLKHVIKLRNIESVGVFDTEGYKKAECNASKKILALVNYENEQSIIYILYRCEKGRRLLFIEPDRGFMMTLRRGVSALTVFDKSIADFEKRMNEADSE